MKVMRREAKPHGMILAFQCRPVGYRLRAGESVIT